MNYLSTVMIVVTFAISVLCVRVFVKCNKGDIIYQPRWRKIIGDVLSFIFLAYVSYYLIRDIIINGNGDLIIMPAIMALSLLIFLVLFKTDTLERLKKKVKRSDDKRTEDKIFWVIDTVAEKDKIDSMDIDGMNEWDKEYIYYTVLFFSIGVIVIYAILYGGIQMFQREILKRFVFVSSDELKQLCDTLMQCTLSLSMTGSIVSVFKYLRDKEKTDVGTKELIIIK